MVTGQQAMVGSQWDDPAQTIILTQLVHKWTWEDLHEHNTDVVLPMLAPVQHPVSIIVEFKSAFGVYASQFTQHVNRATELYRQSNVELIVYTTRVQEIGLLFKAVNLKYGLKNCHYHYASTLDRAREIVALFRQHS